MANILDEIVAHKRAEIAAAKQRQPLAELAASLANAPPPRDFIAALVQPGAIRIIAEVKKASPSAGVIRADFDPVSIAKTYAANGADCLSVLTDEKFFQGRLDYLKAIRQEVSLPLLRKEFILDEYQLFEARAAGADAVLLIAEILPGEMLKDLFQAAQSLGLHVLLELHDLPELPRVLALNPALVGINNRDLRTFHTSLDKTAEAIGRIPKDVAVISESGIRTHKDMKYLQSLGVRGVLVGESLMRSPDIGAALQALRGITR
jgi:indole-3-glycerol phosphate synthase